NVFAVPVFFIVFRETIEAAIIIAVLLAFLKKTLDGPNAAVAVYKSLVKQIWLGAVLGFLLCLIVGGALIGTFYTVGSNAWSAAEYYYEGVFYLLAAVIISVMGVALLRIGKMQEKWRVKLAEALDASVQTGNARGRFKRFATKYSLFILSFITV
ncbi:FTR1 family protein, partial [Vibrio parahaemolyticus]|nr:FTR1 family protein [Vibrio parahaemolyticus]